MSGNIKSKKVIWIKIAMYQLYISVTVFPFLYKITHITFKDGQNFSVQFLNSFVIRKKKYFYRKQKRNIRNYKRGPMKCAWSTHSS